LGGKLHDRLKMFGISRSGSSNGSTRLFGAVNLAASAGDTAMGSEADAGLLSEEPVSFAGAVLCPK
jgi:hypothetical protein